ncbi:Hsp20/alpha crystallin family protein [Marine Group I thaumarchaeote]|uniref:Hsp20/alpha crystallin family protein n=1 Tax=Marine Group I thaumarchaeote TaxID=2511932 RepID=A0A7K4NEG1_9ARCH|nr:Hsp20/alpha crystallin family protein [Marine Group I thaumarchaeote]
MLSYSLSKFSSTSPQTLEKSLNFAIPIVVLLCIGVVYMMSQRAEVFSVNFILIGVATITTIYWVRVLKKMLKNIKPKYAARDAEAKNWVYDLIKGENQFVFVAEVPGPDDKIMVRLIEGILYIKGTSGFSKEVVIENSNEMKISDFKYRNGVLTLRIN